MKTEIESVCAKAKRASVQLAVTTTADKNAMLAAIADALLTRTGEILLANAQDVEQCDRPSHIIDRLRLTEERIRGIADGVHQVTRLPDPIGVQLDSWTAQSGIQIQKVRVPIGVVGIIYEARPNVTIDTAALCVKSGNAVVLRGSKDAIRSNRKLVEIARDALQAAGYDPECIQLITDTTHEGAEYFMTLNRYIDVLVPRGSARLIRSTVEHATIPVIETGVGNCHIYIHASADISMAKRILVNAKTQRPSVCNACESLLVDEALVDVLPEILRELTARGVIVHGCKRTRSVFKETVLATEEDYATEYVGLHISCKVVSGVEEAVAHIATYGTKHSEAIVAEDADAVRYFMDRVDAAAVYHNASTRFTDGFEFGFGAELGISTQKLHARGPIGLTELTSYKYLIEGDGQIRG